MEHLADIKFGDLGAHLVWRISSVVRYTADYKAIDSRVYTIYAAGSEVGRDFNLTILAKFICQHRQTAKLKSPSNVLYGSLLYILTFNKSNKRVTTFYVALIAVTIFRRKPLLLTTR